MHELLAYFEEYGVGVVFLNVLLEQLGAPVPALPTIAVAGALAFSGLLSGWAVLFWAVVASLIADSVWFFLGRAQGYRVLKTLCRISLSPDSCVRQTEGFFLKYGNRSLVVAKFIPGFSTVAPPMSGAAKLKFRAFLLYDGIGALLWIGSGLLAGVLFHGAIDRLLEGLENLGLWALVILGGGLALFILLKWRERRRFVRTLRMARISAPDLLELMQQHPAPVILDVRTRGLDDGRKIPGAILLDVEDLDQAIRDLSPDREVVLYCT